MIGNTSEIIQTCREENIDSTKFTIIDAPDSSAASALAVSMVKSGKADIIMKGLVGTDIFLKAVMDKEKGIMMPGAVLSYVGALQIPAYDKLLLITDPAVIPYPDLSQKAAMLKYAVTMAGRLGIATPKISLIAASEKTGRHFFGSDDYISLKNMAMKGDFGDCIVDGPLDLFLSCDRESVVIKGIKTPVNGEADVLLFPSLEACNPFYKALMLFAGGEIGGLIMGTEKPVVLMSRSESQNSKFYCISMACMMA
jgi:phosphate butyryltransferase